MQVPREMFELTLGSDSWLLVFWQNWAQFGTFGLFFSEYKC